MRMGSILRLTLPVALAVLALSAILFWLDSPRATAQPLAGITRGYPSVQCATTLQACINLSSNGDRITIAAGTYITSVTLDKAVSLLGMGPHTTIIQALPNQRVLTVTGSIITPSTSINALTLMGGNLSGVVCPDACGGAVWVTGGALPSFLDDTLQNNSAYKGGGLYADSMGRLFDEYSNIVSNTVTGSWMPKGLSPHSAVDVVPHRNWHLCCGHWASWLRCLIRAGRGRQ